MSLKSKRLIYAGAIGGLFVGKAVSGIFFGEIYFEGVTVQHGIIIGAFIALGAFVGHIMRH